MYVKSFHNMLFHSSHILITPFLAFLPLSNTLTFIELIKFVIVFNFRLGKLDLPFNKSKLKKCSRFGKSYVFEKN